MSTKDPIRRRTRLGTITILAAAGSVAVAGPAHAGNVEADRNLEIAPAIDFALFETPDLAPGTMVRLEVFRGATRVASKTAQVTDANNVEVNHIGPTTADRGDCWDGDGTPDLRGGDELRATVLDAGLNPTADVDFTFARQIQFTETAGTLTGTAFGDDAGDTTVPLAAGDVFGAKRVIIGGPRFTAEITNLSPTGSWSVDLPGDGGEVSVDWSAVAAGGGNETSTGFPGAEDATGPCGDVKQSALSSNSHPQINIANVGTDMVVGGPEVGLGQATGVTFNGITYVPTHDDAAGTWSATIPAAALGAPLTAGTHALVATFSDTTTDTRSILKDVIAPTLTASLAPGTYTGNQTTSLTSDASGIRYTLDGSAPTATFGTPHADGALVTLQQGGVRVLRARVQDGAGNVTTLGPLSYDIRVPVTPPPGDTGGGAANPGTGQNPGGVTGAGTTGTPPAGLVGSTGGSTFFGLARLRPGVVRVASKARLRTLRRRGIGFSVDLPAEARVVEVRLSRLVGGRNRTVSTVTLPVTTAGRLTTRLASSALRAKLRRGTYVLRIATGRSALTLGDAVTTKLKVVR